MELAYDVFDLGLGNQRNNVIGERGLLWPNYGRFSI